MARIPLSTIEQERSVMTQANVRKDYSYGDIPESLKNASNTITAGRQIAKVLKKEGVDTLFTLCGGHIVTVHEGCVAEGIRVIDVRDEAAAIDAAQGYAFATGKPGVAAVTAGPGVTNAASGVATAFMAGTPVMLIGGRAPMALFDKSPLQDIDQVSLMRPITKFARTIHTPARAGEYAGMAFREMFAGRPGPVFLDLPLDLTFHNVPNESVTAYDHYRATELAPANPHVVRQAIEMLSKAERPVIFAGNGVFWGQAHAELQRFVETAKIPLFHQGQARGCVPDDHELVFGTNFGLALRDADVMLTVGVSFDWLANFGEFGPNLKVIEIDNDRRWIGHNRPAHLGLLGDPKLVLEQLSDAFPKRSEPLPWVATMRSRFQKYRRRLDAISELKGQQNGYMHPIRVPKEVTEFLDRDATLILDGGDIAGYTNYYAQGYLPGRTVFSCGPLGNLGQGLPIAVATKAARPGSQVALITGDGAFGFHAMEFDTAVRHNLPFVCVVANDGGWGNIRWAWKKRHPDGFSVGVDLPFTHYEKIAEAMGGYGELVEDPADLKPALARAFRSGKPACINVLTDRQPGTSPYDNFDE
jgi:acetolactate synthase-1/2/3 large subunit